MNINPSKIHYTNHDITFEWSDEPVVAIIESNGRSDLDFLFDLHEQSCHFVNPGQGPAPAVRLRGGVLGLLTQPDVWSIIWATCQAVAPTILASVLNLLWKDIRGEEDIVASDVYKQNKWMIANFELMLKEYKKLAKKHADIDASLHKMTALFAELPEDAAERATSLLVAELGWEEAKAARGVRVVTQTATKKTGTP